jgi:TonB family protein
MELDKWPKPIGGSISEQIMDHIYYTDNALEAGAQGRVIIRFVVNENGDVEDAFIERGVHQELDDIALHAVNQLEFEPPLKDGKPVKTLMAMPLVFKLPADESKN